MPAVEHAPSVRLVMDESEPNGNGTVVYEALIDGRPVGWVGDDREWKGNRYGARKWWAAWREAGDTAARWNSWSDGTTYRSRKAAADALAAKVAGR